MDYGEMVDLRRHSGWLAFLDSHRKRGGRLVLLTTKAEQRLEDFKFRPDDCLLLGRESAGAPEDVHLAADVRLCIPLVAGARSLNVAVAAGVTLWEALRQTRSLPPA